MVLASLLTFALIGKPNLALGLGLFILIAFWTGLVPYGWPFKLIPGLPSYTEDFVSPFPWFGVACIGVAIGERVAMQTKLREKISRWKMTGWVGNITGFAGKRSLSIYMLHQPVLFALIISAGFLIRLISG